MAKVFISHSSHDRAVIEREIVPSLQTNGVDCWYSKRDIAPSTHWEVKIREGLAECDWFLVIVSPNAAQSQWVKAELDWAFQHRDGRIVPLVVADFSPGDLHLLLRNVQHIDCTRDWDAARQQLLSQIGASIPAAASRGAAQRGRAIRFSAWVYLLAAIVFALIATKTVERMSDSGWSFYDAVASAVRTRARNFSGFVLVAAALSAITYAAAIHFAQPIRAVDLSRRSFKIVIGLMLAFVWGLYLQGVRSASDPGTFFARSHGVPYVCQVIEGIASLAGFAAYAFWTAAAWALAGQIASPKPGHRWTARKPVLLLIAGSLMPAFVLATVAAGTTTDWLRKNWGVSNPWPGLIGFTIVLFLPNAAVLIRVMGRTLPGADLKRA